jgi:hypothetical protein
VINLKESMMRKLAVLVGINLAAFAYADVSPSLANLNSQVNAMQQAILQQQQDANNAISDLQTQFGKLQAQLTQYQSPDFQKFTWAASNGTNMPANAFVAARNGNAPLYICQATYSGDNSYSEAAVIDPGVLTPQGCVITYNGQSFLAPTYSVLISTSVGAWVDGQKVQTQPKIRPLLLARANGNEEGVASATPTSDNSNQPTPLLNQLAVVGGQENSQDIYVCRTQIAGQYFIGKVANNTCNIAAGSKEASWPVYQVLLVRQP